LVEAASACPPMPWLNIVYLLGSLSGGMVGALRLSCALQGNIRACYSGDILVCRWLDLGLISAHACSRALAIWPSPAGDQSLLTIDESLASRVGGRSVLVCVFFFCWPSRCGGSRSRAWGLLLIQCVCG